ncbi:hypothetical protein V8C26DRAFT_206109 [Trichoderma gracile]
MPLLTLYQLEEHWSSPQYGLAFSGRLFGLPACQMDSQSDGHQSHHCHAKLRRCDKQQRPRANKESVRESTAMARQSARRLQKNCQSRHGHLPACLPACVLPDPRCQPNELPRTSTKQSWKRCGRLASQRSLQNPLRLDTETRGPIGKRHGLRPSGKQLVPRETIGLDVCICTKHEAAGPVLCRPLFPISYIFSFFFFFFFLIAY